MSLEFNERYAKMSKPQQQMSDLPDKDPLTMPIEEVRAELKAFGIDTTGAAVITLLTVRHHRLKKENAALVAKLIEVQEERDKFRSELAYYEQYGRMLRYRVAAPITIFLKGTTETGPFVRGFDVRLENNQIIDIQDIPDAEEKGSE
jgi:hypothetical protein